VAVVPADPEFRLDLPTWVFPADKRRSLVALQIDVDGRTREQLRASGIWRSVGLADLPAQLEEGA
jgi:hypothetical protein